MTTPLPRYRPRGTAAGCGAGLAGLVPVQRATAGPGGQQGRLLIAGGAGTPGEVSLLLRKSKLLSWHVLHPEGVHPLLAEERGTPRAGVKQAGALAAPAPQQPLPSGQAYR